MPEINFTIKCNKCKAEVTVTDVEQDATIWIDPFSCNCDHGGDVDCGFDDRTGPYLDGSYNCGSILQRVAS